MSGTPMLKRRISLTLSVQAIELVDELYRRGLWGRTRADVVRRLTERALLEYVEIPKFQLKGERK